MFRSNRGVLYDGDALELLKKIPDESIDLILTDPPYNVSRKGQNVTDTRGKKKRKIILDFGSWDYGMVKWQDFIDDFVRVLKPNGVIILFYEKKELGCVAKYLEEEYGFQTRHIGAWIKSNPVPQMRKVKWMNGVELFLITTKNKGTGHHYNWQLGNRPDYFVHSVSYKHHHPTQKPPKIIEEMIKYWSFEGDVVLDPFAGAGTTLWTAEKLNRKWIGAEIEKEYVNVIVKLFKKEANVELQEETNKNIEEAIKEVIS